METTRLNEFFVKIGSHLGVPKQHSPWALPVIFIGSTAIITGIIVCIVYFAGKKPEETPYITSTKSGTLYKALNSFKVVNDLPEEHKAILKVGIQSDKQFYIRSITDGDDLEKPKYKKLWLGKKYNKKYLDGMQREIITAFLMELLKGNNIIPKYRLLETEEGIVILSEFIPNSSPLYTLIDNRNNKRDNYIKFIKKERDNYFILFLSLILGNKDPNRENFLLLPHYKKIIPIDFGLSLYEGFNLYELIYEKGWDKEILFDKNFLSTLSDSATSFLEKGALYEDISKATKKVTDIVCEKWKDSQFTYEKVMRILKHNAEYILQFLLHVQAEKAIIEENIEELRKIVEILHTRFHVISHQTHDGLIEENWRLEDLVVTRRCPNNENARAWHYRHNILGEHEKVKEYKDYYTSLIKNKDKIGAEMMKILENLENKASLFTRIS